MAAKENMPYRFSAQQKAKHPSTKRNGTLNDLNRVDPFSYLSTVRAPTHGVFGSDTYFTSLKSVGSADLAGERSSSGRLGTPSLRSEASSFNSQTALVPPILHRNGSQAKAVNGRRRRRTFLGFGCGDGSCFDKKGVLVNRRHPPPSQRIDHHIHLPLPPPVLDSAKPVEMGLEESRKSIEVFGSRAATFEGEVAKNMERKLSMLTWDAIPKAQSIEASRNGDDVASDASSDLFEIENISGAPPIMAADDADASSLCTSPASRYAPSEVSIQWSVVTASAAAASDFNDEAAAKKGRNFRVQEPEIGGSCV